jgi:hypothetical protein
MRKGKDRDGSKDTALRFWEIVTLFPDISTPELEERISCFIMRSSVEELFTMSRELFGFATPLLVEDERIRGMMAGLSGKRIALVIEGEYYSVVTLSDRGFRVELGQEQHIPAISVADREHYRDALLKRTDPMRLILERKIKVKGLVTLARWAFPHIRTIRDRGLYDKYLGYQAEIEERVSEILSSLGY